MTQQETRASATLTFDDPFESGRTRHQPLLSGNFG